MLFAGIDHDFAVVLEQINAQWPGMELIGCTTDGEMSSHILFAEDSLALVLLSAMTVTRIRCGQVGLDRCGGVYSRQCYDAVERLATRGGGDRPSSGASRASASPCRWPDRERVRCPQCLAGGVGDAVPIFAAPPATSGDSRHQAVPWQGSTPDSVPSSSSGGRCLFLWCGYRMASHRREGGHRC